LKEDEMKKIFCVLIVLLFAGLNNAIPKDILVNWVCNMDIEILSGRFNPAVDTVSARGQFNGWGRFDLIMDPINPNNYVSPYPLIFIQLEVGDTITFYKFFYTPNTWEMGENKLYILTLEDYNTGTATISRAFNDLTLNNVTNQETVITFEVDCNNAISYITGQPFPVVNTCRLAGGTFPLQWPSSGWPDGDIGLTLLMYDDGTHGDITPNDKKFTLEATFPPFTAFPIQYKYSINYGDWINNGGGNDNEARYTNDHFIELTQYMISAKVENIFGAMGYHNLINVIVIPVELTSFTATIINNDVILNWTTVTEVNNQGFEVQRRTRESEFENIGFVPGFGTTTEPKSYNFTDSEVSSGKYSYKLKQIDFDGSFEYSDEVEIEAFMPWEFSFEQNYPNPFNPSTKISWQVPVGGWQTLKIYDVLGNEVATLVDEYKPAGKYEVEWNASELPSGVYFYQLKAEEYVNTKKMMLIK
jgi:hypothetical protein